MDKLMVLVADDHPVFRQGLCHFLDEEGDIHVVAQAADGEETLRLCQELAPDVAIIDIAMPGLAGIEAAHQMKETCPSVTVLMVSDHDYESYLFASFQAGAAGFILKSAPVSDLVSAVRLVHAGGAVFDFKIIESLLAQSLKDNKVSGIPELRPRELQVLEAAARGLSNRRIGEELGIGSRTVQTHMFHIFRKLKAHSRTQAVLVALRQGRLGADDLSGMMNS